MSIIALWPMPAEESRIESDDITSRCITHAFSAPNAGGIASQMLCFEASLIEENIIRTGYITPASSRLKAGRIATQRLRSRGSPMKRDTVRTTCIIRVFSGAQTRVVVLQNRCVLMGPH